MQALSRSSSGSGTRKTMAVVSGMPPGADAGVVRRPGYGATLVHDAGHLVGALRRYSELMTTPGVLSEEYGHLAQELQVLSDRSAAMLGQLVTSGVDAAAETEPADAEATVLPEAVLDCLGLLSKIAGRAVTFFCSPTAYLPVAVRRSAFERIVVNLVKNAAEEASGNSTVAVTLVGMREAGLERGSVQVVLTVQGRAVGSGRKTDQGTGRAQAGDVRSGIGLQVVRELAESSGAKVEVESEVDAVTSVSVRWPVMDPRRDRRTVTEGMARERFAMAGLPGMRSAQRLAGGETC